jgi:hypothetical protein
MREKPAPTILKTRPNEMVVWKENCILKTRPMAGGSRFKLRTNGGRNSAAPSAEDKFHR